MNFTLVLATPRSGSTMLAGDIRMIGGLGRPKEHFLKLLRAEEPSTPADIMARLRDVGADSDTSPTLGVKVMVGYAPRVAAMLTGETHSPRRAMSEIIKWARAEFDAVNIVALRRRAIFEQALSHAKALETGVWHNTGDREISGNQSREFADSDEMNYHILQKSGQLIKQNQSLSNLVKMLGDDCLSLEYEDIAADEAGCEATLRAHASKMGLTPGDGTISRNLQKLVSPEEAEAKRESFRQYMNARLFDQG